MEGEGMSLVKIAACSLSLIFLHTIPEAAPAGFVEDMAKCSAIKSQQQQQACYQNAGKPKGTCRQFVELLPVADVAQEYGQSEEWVVANHKVNLWAQTSENGKKPKVGELLPGSRALLLETSTQDYKVKSPFDGSTGWVNHIQVKGFRTLNDKTFQPCDSQSVK
jgi:hypothetical protein